MPTYEREFHEDDSESSEEDKDTWIDDWVEDNRSDNPTLSNEQLTDKAYLAWKHRNDD